jgi:hypothetical protein
MIMKKLIAKYHAWKGTSPKARKIFIIGTGRSGTHWAGYILKAHPDCYATIEDPRIFNLVTEMALNPTRRKDLFTKLLVKYRYQHTLVAPKHYLDKSHPNIWLAEDLAKNFSDAIFIGILRNPYATVASMLKHRGVLFWIERWKEFPVPNQFLGITRENASEWEQLSLAAKCALRWRSHAEQMAHLKNALGSKLYLINYEELISGTERELRNLENFLNLDTSIPLPEVKRKSLDKWKSELSQEVCMDIETIVGET